MNGNLDNDQLLRFLDDVKSQLVIRLGQEGADEFDLYLRDLIDILSKENRDMASKRIKELVAHWALIGNKDPIPIDKFDKPGILKLITNPEFISDRELVEVLLHRMAS
jgi:hypothetical protein